MSAAASPQSGDVGRDRRGHAWTGASGSLGTGVAVCADTRRVHYVTSTPGGELQDVHAEEGQPDDVAEGVRIERQEHQRIQLLGYSAAAQGGHERAEEFFEEAIGVAVPAPLRPTRVDRRC